MKAINNILIMLSILINCSCAHEKVKDARMVDSLPPIFPDYSETTIPVNIAPLNIAPLDSTATLIDVEIKGGNGTSIHAQSSGAIDLDIDGWHNLLSLNAGGTLQVTVSTKHGDRWLTYKPFDIYVSADSIDYGITYRLIAPGYEKYSKMGIYERRLSDFTETPVFENSQVNGCVNCHSYRQGDTRYMSMHVRGEHGATMLRAPELPMDVYNTSTDATLSACVYPYWHPSGRYIAYSTNSTRQMVHLNPEKFIEVFDLASDVHVYDTKTGQLLVPQILKNDSVWETFPAFAPDGKTLYYCAAKAVDMPDSVKTIRYDLCSISFDPESGTFGNKIDTLYSASAQGKSATFPRPSYDGRCLIFTLSDYGTFPIWHDEADLMALDLSTGVTRPLTEVNSDKADSYHSWSSNSRWLVFGSRRLDGLHTVPYIAHIGTDGKPGKPFLLPQRDPRNFYDTRYCSFNIPEFITSPVDLDRNALEDKLTSPARTNFKTKMLQRGQVIL